MSQPSPKSWSVGSTYQRRAVVARPVLDRAPSRDPPSRGRAPCARRARPWRCARPRRGRRACPAARPCRRSARRGGRTRRSCPPAIGRREREALRVRRGRSGGACRSRRGTKSMALSTESSGALARLASTARSSALSRTAADRFAVCGARNSTAKCGSAAPAAVAKSSTTASTPSPRHSRRMARIVAAPRPRCQVRRRARRCRRFEARTTARIMGRISLAEAAPRLDGGIARLERADGGLVGDAHHAEAPRRPSGRRRSPKTTTVPRLQVPLR